MKILIVGGVAGGASAAARLRRLDEHAQIILFERGEYISFANCGLPYYVGGEIDRRSALTVQTPESFRARFNVDVRTGSEVLEIHPDEKNVRVRDAATGKEYTESYDQLVLSPGAAPLRPPIPGAGDERVFTLRTIPDTLAIKAVIDEKRPRRAAVVGGGYIGVEMAENLVRAGLEVTLIEMMDHVIAPLDMDVACDVHHYLGDQGVDLRLDNAVEAFEPGEGGLTVRLKKGSVETDLVILAVGVRSEGDLARAAGLDVSPRGGILVDGHMRTSDPHIYAVGDAVVVHDFVTGEPAFVPLAGPANRQGRIAADNICGIPSVYKGTQGSAVLKVFDMTVAMTGVNERTARARGLDCDKVFLYTPSHATYYPGARNMSMKVLYERGTGRILGGQIAGFEGVDKRCDVLATAIRAGLTAQDLTELELCYAPPYSSAKDPVNMAGFVIENVMTGKVKNFHWHDVDGLPRDGSVTLLDVRTPREVADGEIPGFISIPLDELRQRMAEIPLGKPVYATCHSGLRSYIACRILSQNGYDCYNLSGGYRLYDSMKRHRDALKDPVTACGAPDQK